MKAFISYAIEKDEQYILNLLAAKLHERGMTLTSGGPHPWPRFESQISAQISECALFIGLITQAGAPFLFQTVLGEFNEARRQSKPSILLAEEGILAGGWLPDAPNTIRFNRHNINAAIEQVNSRISLTNALTSGPNDAAWLLGGIAVLALLAYLSNDKK